MNELWRTDEEGIIILDEKGEEITNQTGGYACHHPVERGRFKRLWYIRFEILEHYFWHILGGYCWSGIDKEIAQAINKILRWTPIRVDMDRLKDSEEAWLYVKYWGKPAVLTWCNSD